MKRISTVGWHRLLGGAAIIHAAGSFLATLALIGNEMRVPPWVIPLWVGVTALWFLWPLVLALHPAQSARRVLLPLGLSAPFVVLWFRWWSSVWGPQVVGLPEFVELTPLDLGRCAFSYVQGWTEGKLAVRRGEFVLEGYGFGFWAPRAPKFSDEDRNQCGIKLNAVAACVVDTHIVSHARGWNDVTMSALRRRCPDIVKAAEQRDAQWEQSWHDGRRDGQADATNDIRAGVLAIEVDVSHDWKDDDFEQLLRQRYQLGMRRVDPRANENMANRISGHQYGYNEVAEAEIEKRLGKEKIKEIWSNRLFEPQPRR
ncbi:MAG TPA: hypothetical protein VJ719_14790 [Chthoniobacterales bacterium]|nr:hypothetical protein [Chthoniobacterales bacterium]